MKAEEARKLANSKKRDREAAELARKKEEDLRKLERYNAAMKRYKEWLTESIKEDANLGFFATSIDVDEQDGNCLQDLRNWLVVDGYNVTWEFQPLNYRASSEYGIDERAHYSFHVNWSIENQ